MDSNLFNNFAGAMSCFISQESNKIARLFKHVLVGLKRPGYEIPDEFRAGTVRDNLFMSVTRALAEMAADEDFEFRPEEAVTKLIRLGIPKKCTSATFKYLTARLPNASYRLYRSTGEAPDGTIMVRWHQCCVYVRPQLSPEELARFILLLDSRLPEIDEAAENLFREMQVLFMDKQKENMAMEIAGKAVETQIADVFPGMGIKAKYKIADGKVKLNLTRTYTAQVELPLQDLGKFLANPGRIESALKVEPVPAEPEKATLLPPLFSPTYFQSNIILNPNNI